MWTDKATKLTTTCEGTYFTETLLAPMAPELVRSVVAAYHTHMHRAGLRGNGFPDQQRK
jgi:hypothetical protein